MILAPVNSIRSFAFGADSLVKQSNAIREQFNADPLNANPQLMSAAQAKAEHMAKNRYFAHFAPDGTTPWQFFKEQGYSYKIAGENLAITNEDEDAVIKGWLESPTHKENLINTAYSDIGIGIANYGDYQNNKDTTVIVAFYGTANSPLLVTGTEPTNPAGTVAALRPTIYDTKMYSLITLGIALVAGGIILESRHIRRFHKIL